MVRVNAPLPPLPHPDDWAHLVDLRQRELAREAHGALRSWTRASDELNRLMRRALDGERITGHASNDQG